MIGVSRNKRTTAPNYWKASLVWASNSNRSIAGIKSRSSKITQNIKRMIVVLIHCSETNRLITSVPNTIQELGAIPKFFC
jgi:hypothetical protein